MSDVSGPFSTLIEDWSGVTTSVVIPAGQHRWYDGVTGYQATEVIELVGNGTSTIAALLKRQPLTDGVQTVYGVKTFNAVPVLPATVVTSDNQAANKKYVDDNTPGFLTTFDVEDTDSADVAATTPSSPGNGDVWIVVNSGSSGNYVTGLPNSISLGDDKSITFKYDLINTTWRYEDVIIDYYSIAATGTDIAAGSTAYVYKWSGGRMTMGLDEADGTNSLRTWTFPESFIAGPRATGSARKTSAVMWYQESAPTTTQMTFKDANDAGSGQAVPSNVFVEGRWKA